MNIRNKRSYVALGGLLMSIGMLAVSVFMPSVNEDAVFRIPDWKVKSVYANDEDTRMMTGDVPIGCRGTDRETCRSVRFRYATRF